MYVHVRSFSKNDQGIFLHSGTMLFSFDIQTQMSYSKSVWSVLNANQNYCDISSMCIATTAVVSVDKVCAPLCCS